PIAGATEATLAIAAATFEDSGFYSACVTDAFGTATSALAALDVDATVHIVTQPQDRTVLVGASVSLSVVASAGAAPLADRWRKDGADVPGATGDVLVLAGVTLSDDGSYDVVVTGPCGSATSDSARVRVLAQPPIVIDEIRVAASAGDPDRYFELA